MTVTLTHFSMAGMTIEFEFYFLAKLMSLGFGILPLPSSTGSLININDKKKNAKKIRENVVGEKQDNRIRILLFGKTDVIRLRYLTTAFKYR